LSALALGPCLFGRTLSRCLFFRAFRCSAFCFFRSFFPCLVTCSPLSRPLFIVRPVQIQAITRPFSVRYVFSRGLLPKYLFYWSPYFFFVLGHAFFYFFLSFYVNLFFGMSRQLFLSFHSRSDLLYPSISNLSSHWSSGDVNLNLSNGKSNEWIS